MSVAEIRASSGECGLNRFYGVHAWGASAFAHEAPVTDCDTHAASDQDPQRKSTGISFDKIDAGLAVPACEAAVQQYPESSRLNFQLGRAYSKANNFGAAVAQYRKAADQANAEALALIRKALVLMKVMSANDCRAVLCSW